MEGGLMWGDPGPRGWDYISGSDAAFNIAWGAVRSGKTVASSLRWIHYIAREAPPGDLMMLGKTERTLKQNILNPLVQFLGESNCSFSLGRGEGKILNRQVYLVGMNDDRAEGKIRGATLAGALGDEITLWPEGCFSMLTTRLSVPGAKFFGTTNPDSPYHWLKSKYLDKADGQRIKTWRFALNDNPHLTEDYKNTIRSMHSGLFYQRFIEGKWVAAEGAIYPQFEESVNVAEAPRPGVLRGRWIAAVDYGANNPCGFGLFWVGHIGYEPVIWQAREYYHDARATQASKTNAELAADFGRFCGSERPEAVWVDPSATSFITELRRNGWAVHEADNDVLPGIACVGEMLSKGRLTFAPGCRHTIEEMTGYQWDDKAALRGEDKPKKVRDHMPDMVRYLCYNAGRVAAPVEIRKAAPRLDMKGYLR
jgi:PBSX family phage terminase large subunit